MYTKEQLEVAKTILLNLISEDRDLDDEYFGICWNADHLLNQTLDVLTHFDMYFFIKANTCGWEHHTGDDEYPVPNVRDYGKWEGTNLTLRIDLMKYIVGKIDNLLGEM